MEQLKKYLKEILGLDIQPEEILKKELGKLPYFFGKMYNLNKISLSGRDIILAEYLNSSELKILQLDNHFRQLRKHFNLPVVLVAEELPSITRKRLIEKKISFIVPDKQLYLPDLMIDLRERVSKPMADTSTLLPSAQVIILYRILNRNENIEELTLKQLAVKINYSAMTISNAVDNLIYLKLGKVMGTKEKYIRFNQSIPDLWNRALPLLVNPVFRRHYVDQLPENLDLLKAGETALPAYSNMNPGVQSYYAIEKSKFYGYKKKRQWINLNDYEGKYCLEVWKYDPAILTGGLSNNCVDPLSLYLTLKEIDDERINMALDKIIKAYIW